MGLSILMKRVPPAPMQKSCCLAGLTFGRVEELTAEYTFITLGYDPQKHLRKQPAMDLKTDGYLAFSKDSDPELIKSFREELERMKKSGEYASLIKNSLRTVSVSVK